MARKELAVAPREVLGKKVAQLRRTGVLPGNIFGRGLESVAVQVDAEELVTTLRSMTANEVFDLKVAGERAARPVVLHKVQRHPLGKGILHLDFYQVSLREKMRGDVPLTIVGTSNAVATYNGVLLSSIETVQIEALPLDFPTHIEVDVTSLRHLEDSLHVRDLVVAPNVAILTDGDVVVVKVASPRVSEEEGAAAEMAAAAEEAEGEPEAATEGEAPSA